MPERIIAELVRRYPTPWSRRQMSAVPADARVGGIPALGACHYCLAVVDPPRRWCNATCRSVWLQDERDLGVEWGDVGE